ncbi:MAG: hypothetical protein SF052_03460 [Bacteroidia bacterium]|nr:hypothetical protein [Bacteroidia bacterium]
MVQPLPNGKTTEEEESHRGSSGAGISLQWLAPSCMIPAESVFRKVIKVIRLEV